MRFNEVIACVDWGDIATWLGSVGTVGTLIFTLRQLYNDRNERKSNELKFQAKEISAWIDNSNKDITIVRFNNLSNTPVYSVVLTIVCIKGAGQPIDGTEAGENYKYRSIFSVLPPGKFKHIMNSPGRGMFMEYGIEIAFTDSSGNSWIRKSNGELITIKQEPTDYYNISHPFSFSSFDEIMY